MFDRNWAFGLLFSLFSVQKRKQKSASFILWDCFCSGLDGVLFVCFGVVVYIVFCILYVVSVVLVVYLFFGGCFFVGLSFLGLWWFLVVFWFGRFLDAVPFSVLLDAVGCCFYVGALVGLVVWFLWRFWHFAEFCQFVPFQFCDF